MKSPISGNDMVLARELRSLEFRKSNFDVLYHFYHCVESGEQFTSTDLDELNLNQVYNQYRAKFGIPFPTEITRIREQYNVSASKMSEILGLGVNSYRNYESGEMSSVSNAKLIHMADNPSNFLDMVLTCESLTSKEKTKLKCRVHSIIEEYEANISDYKLREYLLGNESADIYSGYNIPNMGKLAEMVVYFSELLQPFKTKLNKLLFYADFLMFKKTCQSISGVRYKAIEMGPVPNNFNSIYEYLNNKNDISISYKEFPKGYSGEQFFVGQGRRFNAKLFSELELNTLHNVANRFSESTTNEIIELSHMEEAWQKDHTEKKIISYLYAFELK
jgi:transcriptional regulator with XRE-family HTH domain